jgi:glycine reductase
MKIKFIHYINQFYGQIGGEDKADQKPLLRFESVGPGKEIQRLLGDEGEVVATVICGDTYYAENMEEATKTIINFLEGIDFNCFIAGPAFNAGRYGMACGGISEAVQEHFNIPAVTSMYEENPGIEIYNKYIYILKGGNSAVSMRKDIAKAVSFSKRLLKGECIGFPDEEGYIPQGRRVNVQMEKSGAIRAVDMLIKKMKVEDFETELPMPVFEKVEPANAISDLLNSTIALVTTGGIVPKGNPDKIESANASKFGKYSIDGIEDLEKEEYITVHGGYDPVYALEDPDRVLPLDAMRILEKEGKFGKLFNYFYSTVGNTTSVSNAKIFGEEIGKDLLSHGVDGVILTST